MQRCLQSTAQLQRDAKQLQLPWRTEALQSDQCGHASKTLIKTFLFPFSPSCLGPSDVRCSHELSILLSVGNTQKQKAGSLLGTPGSFCPWSKGAGCNSTLLPQYSALAMPCCISLSTCPSGEQPLAPFPPWSRNVYFKRLRENRKIKEEGWGEHW